MQRRACRCWTDRSLFAAHDKLSTGAPPAARALSAVPVLGLDLGGVDIASDESGRRYVLEVNGAVDFDPTYAGDIFAMAVTALLDSTSSVTCHA